MKRIHSIVLLVLTTSLLIVACGTTQTNQINPRNQTAIQSVPIAANATPTAQKVIAAGAKYLGVPYEFGSNRATTTTFDCSDFSRQAFLDGIQLKIPGDSRKQADYVRNIGRTSTNWKNLRPGDLMFFMSYRGSRAGSYSNINKATQRITHVSIYLGDGNMLHTYSKQSGGVRVDKIAATHWEYRFIFGGSASR